MPQSDALSAETRAMRAVDLALQQAGNLKGRARDRVLRYAAEEAAGRLAAEAAGDGGATSFGSVTANGGSAGAPGTEAHVRALGERIRADAAD
jgi:hypothetical protein